MNYHEVTGKNIYAHKPFGRMWGEYASKLRLKEWEHFGIFSGDHYIGTVVFHAGFATISFIFIADVKKQKVIFEASRTLPPLIADIRRGNDGIWSFKSGDYELKIEDDPHNELHAIDFAASEKGGITAEGSLIVKDSPSTNKPLDRLIELGNNRTFYTRKAACPVYGNISVNGQLIKLDERNSIALIDEQRTYYPYLSFWNWGTFAFYDAGGSISGANLCQNFIGDDDERNENCIWHNGKVHSLPAVFFDFDSEKLMLPWKITTKDGSVDLTFSPSLKRHETVNAVLIKTSFSQIYGAYSGFIHTPEGKRILVDNVNGIAEEHFSRY